MCKEICVGEVCSCHHHHHHQSLNREDHLGTTDDFATSFLHFPCSPLPSGTCRTPGLSSVMTSPVVIRCHQKAWTLLLEKCMQQHWVFSFGMLSQHLTITHDQKTFLCLELMTELHCNNIPAKQSQNKGMASSLLPATIYYTRHYSITSIIMVAVYKLVS